MANPFVFLELRNVSVRIQMENSFVFYYNATKTIRMSPGCLAPTWGTGVKRGTLWHALALQHETGNLEWPAWGNWKGQPWAVGAAP